MAFGDKLKFWKKEEDFSDLGDFGLGDLGKKEASAASSDEDIFGKGFGAEPGAAEPMPGAAPGMPGAAEQPMPTQPEGMAQPVFPSAAERAGVPAQPQVPPPQYTSPTDTYSKDMELISAKLDSIRATLESMNQRLANLERMAQGESKKKYEW
jgi:hypothetical protein